MIHDPAPTPPSRADPRPDRPLGAGVGPDAGSSGGSTLRAWLRIALALLGCALFVLLGSPAQADAFAPRGAGAAQLGVEVRVPERLVLQLGGPVAAERAVTERAVTARAARAGAAPARSGGQPPCRARPAAGEDAAGRVAGGACLQPDDASAVFDLNCATLGPPPPRCAELYGDAGGRLLDHRERPYPPIAFDAQGRSIPGSRDFPSVFVHPPMQLHVFANSGSFKLWARMEVAPVSGRGEVLDAGHFAMDSVAADSVPSGCGSQSWCAPAPEWTCLGEHPAWRALGPGHRCPAPSRGPHGILLEDHSGARGWQAFAVGLALLLDGSETAGAYRGQIVYTVVDFGP